MKTLNDIKKLKGISYLSSKAINNAINIGFISTVIGITVDTFSYYNSNFLLLTTLNSLAALIVYVSYSLFLLKKIRLQLAAEILLFTVISSIYFTNILFVLQNESIWQLIMLREMFLIVILIVLTSIVLSNKHLVIMIVLFIILVISISVLSYPSYISENALYFIITISVFSYALFLVKREFLNSLNENIILAQQNNLQKQEILQQKIKLAEEQESRLNETISLKNKELLSTAIVFSQNGAVLKKIKSILISHKTQVDPHIFAELDNTLIESLENNTNFHWEIFKKRFSNLDIGFMNTLLKQYPTLSPADQKLATLIKLGLSTKEISTIMQNTPASVQVARSRLRKKLKLDLSDNLAVILSKIQ